MATTPTSEWSDSAEVTAGAGATTAIISTPGASKQIWIDGLYVRADTAAGTVVLKDSASTVKTGAMAISDEGAIDIQPTGNLKVPRFKLPTNTGFSITTVGCSLGGFVNYHIVSV